MASTVVTAQYADAAAEAQLDAGRVDRPSWSWAGPSGGQERCTFGRMSRRARIRAYGLAGLLTAAGVLCGVFVNGLTGQLLTIVLISFGLGGAVLLVFLEVGLSEDRERAREKDGRRKRASQRPSTGSTSRARQFRWPRRPS
jgi:hypothetical protein